METIKILFLAILQGFTEFLPVSSSGHLAIFDQLLGLQNPGTRVEIMLHFGTLFSVVIFYWKRIYQIVGGLFCGERSAWRMALNIIIASIPAAIVYFLLDEKIEAAYDGNLHFIGLMLVITGFILLSLRFVKSTTNTELSQKADDSKDAKTSLTLFRAFLIGCAQAFALLPGISRSGSTIACARHLGVHPKEAAEFSFLMVLPLLLAAATQQLIKDFSADTAVAAQQIPSASLFLAVIVSAVSGYFSLRLILATLVGRKFWIFGIYCFLAGISVILFS